LPPTGTVCLGRQSFVFSPGREHFAAAQPPKAERVTAIFQIRLIFPFSRGTIGLPKPAVRLEVVFPPMKHFPPFQRFRGETCFRPQKYAENTVGLWAMFEKQRNKKEKRENHKVSLQWVENPYIMGSVKMLCQSISPYAHKRGASMIRLKNVEMEYDNGTKAIRGITLSIDDGEFVFLVGPSGSGKSTIIKLLTGEVEPSAGRIMINGFSVSNISGRQIPLMRRTLGVIFQDFRLIDQKTVYENLEFVMRAVGASPKAIRERISYVLDLVGLQRKAKSYPTELSGGEQQRVAIARALVNNPNTIIADEPTGNLDPDRSLELMSLLVKINQLGTTVVVVTHEKDLVNRFGKRVITIESGHVVNDSVGRYVGGHIHG